MRRPAQFVGAKAAIEDGFAPTNGGRDVSRTFAVITGGGTTGHVAPALAIVEALVARGHPLEALHYVGSARGIETRLIPPTGVPHTFLDVVGLQRRVTAIRRNAVFLPRLVRAAGAATELLRRLCPSVVVNVGGYASYPATRAARKLGIPIVVVSYDRRPGLVSRVAARWAAACAVAFPGSRLPRARVTGAPVRRSLVTLDRAASRAAARDALRLPDERFVLAVVAGSLGSRLLNATVASLVQRHRADRELAVRHVVGERFTAEASSPLGGHDGILYQVIGYEDRMDLVYAAADVVLARAGASTIAEIATVGVPSIVVPWAGAVGDHQTANARTLTDADAAIMLAEGDLGVDVLDRHLSRLRENPAEREALGRRAHQVGAVHRGGALVDVIEEFAA